MFAEVKAGKEAAATSRNNGTVEEQRNDLPEAVAITSIKVPFDLGSNAEERLPLMEVRDCRYNEQGCHRALKTLKTLKSLKF